MMKHIVWMPLVALLLVSALLNGCGEKAEQAAQEMKNEAQEASQDATAAAKQKMDSAAAWTKEKIDAYLGDMQKQLGNFDTQFEELSAKAGSLGDAAKEKFQGQFAALTEKKEAVAAKMEELQGASGDAWEKAKLELDALMAELGQLYENLKKDFSTT